MKGLKKIALAMIAGASVAACGQTVLKDQHSVHFAVGGQVTYVTDGSPLPGVSVTLTGIDGKTTTATTDSEGLWSMTGLVPAVYAASYEAAGYESQSGTVDLSAFGPNEVSNPYVVVPTVKLSETLLRATLAPFGTELTTGESKTDGFGGNVLVYSVANDGAISVGFPYRVFNGNVRLSDQETGQQINATLDSNGTSFTFSKTEIDNLNGGSQPLTSDTNPYTWARIQISNVQSYTPIHGDPVFFSASAYFNATP